MVRKKTEGNEEQRRKAARAARAKAEAPSAAQVTTGASEQRRHQEGAARHDERIGDVHAGKQQPHSPQPRPQSVPDREPARKR